MYIILLYYLVLHCDIATKNVLLDYDLTPKISDFGLARMTDTEFAPYSSTNDGQPQPIE